MRFPTRYNPPKNRGQVFEEESMTIPGKDLTVKQILTKFAYNQPVNVSLNPIYDDEDFDDPTLDPDFDLADVPGEQELNHNKKILFENLKNAQNNAVQEKNATTTINDDDAKNLEQA